MINEIMNDIDDMPSLPVTVTKVMEITKNPDVSATELKNTISLDPVLTGKVLKLVNSAYYGLGTKITSMVQAIILLGINTIRNLAMSTAVLSTMGKFSKALKKGPLTSEGFWRHSIGTGVTAKIIAKHIGVQSKNLESFFITGLLHDIGKLVINMGFYDEFLNAILQAEKDKKSLYIKEKELLTIDHAEVGKLLCDKWKITRDISIAIEYHHKPTEVPEDVKILTYALHVANIFCNNFNIGFAGDRIPDKYDPDILKELKLNDDILSGWEETIENEIQKASIFMKIQEEEK